ncbi:MAG: enoyl-CoA hydratase/isomerase family protein [Deltaproteobacteria bacterium]|nr:enoyl-CoA hydratase/isomerase family protein [Deltaproteobacteria bacterium]
MMEAVTLGTVVRAPAIVRTELRDDGIAVLTMDDPGETHNTITPQLGAELSAALDAAFSDTKVKGLVVRGKRDSFLAGANIDFVSRIRFAREAEEAAREVSKRFARLGEGPKPVVACVHGPALGGGFEMALACSAIVASDDPKTMVGLPEVKLGLMPAANGLLRVAERAGLQLAIDLGLTGRSLRPHAALALGLVDEVVAPSIAIECACQLAGRLAAGETRARATRRATLERVLLEKNPIGRVVLFRKARAAARKQTRGHYPAADRMLDVLERYGNRGFRAAAELEARLFGDLVVSETAHRMIELFFAHGSTKKDPGVLADERERARATNVERVSVIGAGLMGAGIATVSVQAGATVRMKDTDDLALGRGLKYVRDVLDDKVRRGSSTTLERDKTFARLSGTIDYSGVASADLVIEAVFEDLALKHAVLHEVEKLVSDTCVVATNTSSLPIAKIAEAARAPQRVLGMHYMSPVQKMPLLEVIRTKHTDPSAVATAVAFGKRQGKTVIVVHDGPAFYTTRILAPYLSEAAQLLAEGVTIERVDDALVDWGFPVGPLSLLDEIGIDVAAHVSHVVFEAFGERMRPSSAMDRLRADHRAGRKNGRGFYLYGRRKGARRPDDTIYEVLGAAPRERPKPEELSLRCTTLMVNEALRCLDEGIVKSARDGDVGAVLGLGFPAFRGGPFRMVDVLGPQEVLRRTRSLEQRLGARFEPAPLLVDMARKGKRFYG